MNLYLNNTYWGSFNGKGVFGIKAAASIYYGKELSQLTSDEFYGIIAMPIAPNYYHPIRNPKVHSKRAMRVKAVASGKCVPSSWLDLKYKHCADDT
ncbi:transglycosylase domain-containing protein [Parashewanella curva]|uniref:transglycosylase domain-containing protein n=1 Tax=Parashewanella curva TaxID=2338552 RepID=UPI001FB40E3A|nr:transglycosylase domain-containing protein [Parashewanella curva]